MIEKSQSRPGVIKLNSESGLIGMPSQTTRGICARCLINPAIKQHSLVYIDQKDIQGAIQAIDARTGLEDPRAPLAPTATDGLYQVMKIDVFGDTRGNPWYTDLETIAKNVPGIN